MVSEGRAQRIGNLSHRSACTGRDDGGFENIALAAAGDLGLAFQLVDDLIGSFGTRKQAGRAPGADLREA